MPDATDQSTDPLAAALTAIKGRAAAAADFPLAEIAQFLGPGTRSVGGWIAASAMDVPRLVAAVEAVLALADEAIPALGMSPADCTSACEDGPCNCSGNARPVAWTLDPARVREAITRALNGENHA